MDREAGLVGNEVIWVVAGLAAALIVVRPCRWPEAVWAVAGAVVLLAAGLMPWREALAAVGGGLDVYLFLTGMMLLSEVARREGVFDWVAGLAVIAARGSARRLYLLVYGVGTVVTALLSNDATAVVLTPAVFAATKAAGVEPLPYLFVCAFIANAASFVLPISNPANLVLYAGAVPPLGQWLGRFALASVLSVGATLAVLLLVERKALRGRLAAQPQIAALRMSGKVALAGIGVTVVALLAASALGAPLGWPTCLCGVLTAAVVLLAERQRPWPMLREMSWGVLPLVAGLFVLVAAVGRTGVLQHLQDMVAASAARDGSVIGWASGIGIALASNVMNNLSAGVIAGHAAGHVPGQVRDALLIGVDLGPNLSITGSLATILWLSALRREGEHVSFVTFLKRGALVMPPALVLALGALLLG